MKIYGLGALVILALFLVSNYVFKKGDGKTCSTDKDCRFRHVCIEADGDSYCTAKCSKDEDCGAGWTCEQTILDKGYRKYQGGSYCIQTETAAK